MDLAKANQIEGFTYDTELEWLAAAASGKNQIAEIGCWKGRSTRAMADNTSGLVWAIDTWKGTEADGHIKEFEGKPENWLWCEFLKNLDDHITSGKVIPIMCASPEAVDVLRFRTEKKFFDMIFIDAAHDYESVKADILAWLPLLKPSGLFCGHDSEREGVEQAVKECIPNFEKVGIGSLWAMKKGTE